MLEVISVFASQFFMIMLVGLNQLNIVNDNLYTAMVTSSLIGVCSFFNINVISGEEAFSYVWWAFIVSGGLAIGASMKAYPFLQRALESFKKTKI